MEKKKITITAFCERAGIARGTYYRFLRGDGLQHRTVIKIIDTALILDFKPVLQQITVPA